MWEWTLRMQRRFKKIKLHSYLSGMESSRAVGFLRYVADMSLEATSRGSQSTEVQHRGAQTV